MVGLAALLIVPGSSLAAGFADGGFESGFLAGPFSAPLPLSQGMWTKISDDSRLVSPPGIVHSGNFAYEVDTRNSPHGSAIYQDFNSGTLSYIWTFWVYRSEGTNVAELIYNWDRGTRGRALVGSWFMLTSTDTQFNGWNGNATFPAVPPGGWHEVRVLANRCTSEQEVRLDGAHLGTVKAVTAPTSGNATVAFGDVAFNAFHALYNYDDIGFELFDCSPPQRMPCPLSQGFWKTHPKAWPVSSLVLGDETYSKAELLQLLRTPTKGDASLILARQLIAAKLNIANGSDPAPVAQAIADADALLAPFAGKLPYHVRPSSDTGRKMTALAHHLDKYNNGRLTPNCVGCSDEEDDHDHERDDHERDRDDHEHGRDRHERDRDEHDRDDDCDDHEDRTRPDPRPQFDLPSPFKAIAFLGAVATPAGIRASRRRARA